MDPQVLQKIEQILEHKFSDEDLPSKAFMHSSAVDNRLDSNERLEFLGDAVLDLVVSEYLMAALPAANEGELSRIRADVVAMSSLAGLASKLGLGPSLLLGKGEFGSGGREE